MNCIKKEIYKIFCFFICSSSFHTAFSQSHSHPHDHAASLNMDVKVLFPSATPDRIILNLTATPETSIGVNWRTDTTITKGEIQVAFATDGTQFLKNVRTIYANSEYLKVKYQQEPEVSAYYHSGIIENLEPGALYVYRVGDDKQWSEWFQFRMPTKDPNRPISFLYFGDAQNDVKSLWSRVIREAYKTMPEVNFMLHAGDLINRHDHDVEWGEWFYAGSYIHSTVPSVMTPGNHEYGKGKLSPHWRPQFTLPTNGPKGLEETCYEVNYADLKVISLNAEEIDESEHYATTQAKWLDSVLTNNPRKWTAITLHYPFYSTKPNRDNIELRKRFKPILDKHKVDIVLQGHDHAYGRGIVYNTINVQGNKNQSFGTVYVVSVSGPKMYDISNDPWMSRKASNTQLFQLLTVKGNVLSYKAFTATGELYDAFELQKQVGKANVLVNKIPKTAEKN